MADTEGQAPAVELTAEQKAEYRQLIHDKVAAFINNDAARVALVAQQKEARAALKAAQKAERDNLGANDAREVYELVSSFAPAKAAGPYNITDPTTGVKVPVRIRKMKDGGFKFTVPRPEKPGLDLG